ncbi:MAG: hypothetical protein GXP42_01865, partial [Chloroflexi bacterium]|nr:hypothetical protein [Chloroflexota bacterium]
MERIAFAARRHRLALAIITGLSLIFIACVSVNAQPTPDDLPPLPPSCVFPSTCYVDQANDADEADGTVVHPFRKFINGMALAREWGLRRNSVGEVIVMPGHYA